MNALLLYPFILAAGALQAAGNSMNARLRVAMVNPWLAASVSFSLIVFVFVALFFTMPLPLPDLETLGKMPWWAPLGGVAGAVAVFGGLAFVDKVGAGPFNGLLITANILTSLAIDNFGWLGMKVHGLDAARSVGALLMVVGIILIARSTARATEVRVDQDNEVTVEQGETFPLLYPFIMVAGVLQPFGVSMNAASRRSGQSLACRNRLVPARRLRLCKHVCRPAAPTAED